MKVNLIIEVPEKCEDCPMFHETDGTIPDICQLKECEDWRDCIIEDSYTRPEWCPLNKCEPADTTESKREEILLPWKIGRGNPEEFNSRNREGMEDLYIWQEGYAYKPGTYAAFKADFSGAFYGKLVGIDQFKGRRQK